MIVKDFRIDGFGVWNDLELSDLDGGLTLLYGENETGKTTLLEFMRSVLYGYGDERRTKYLPPVHGGSAGGSLALEAAAGKFRVRRRPEGDPLAGRLDLTNLTGVAQDSRLLKKILGDLDETTFKNVFALGLGEIQELSSLSGTGAAEFLYDLAVGSGGVSLTEVHRELENSRNRLFSAERNSTIGQLLDRRAALKAEIDQLRQHGRGYALLADERERLAGDIDRCEVESGELRRNVGVLETAVTVHARWTRRNEVAEQLADLAELAPIADEVWQKLDNWRQRRRDQLPVIERLKKERAEAKKQALAVEFNQVVWQQGPRIELLAAQESWIETLESEIKRLEAEAAKEDAAAPTNLGGRREAPNAEWVKLGITPSAAEKLGDRKALRTLHRVLRDAAAAGKRVESAAAAEAQRRELVEAAAAADVGTRREPSLTLDDKSQLVANLRKRVQLDQKIEQLSGHRDETQRQLRELLSINTVPADAIFNPGVFFVVGVCAFLSGIILPDTVIGDGVFRTLLTIGGGMSALFAGAFKVMRDTSKREQLDTLRRQSRTLETQLHELTTEREANDALLPAGGGPMLARLQAAEKDLASTEETAAGAARRETVRDAVREDLEDTRVELRVAEEESQKAQKRLKQEFERLGLPERLTWPQIRSVYRSRSRHDARRRRTERRDKYLDQRRTELALVAERLSQLFIEARLDPKGDRVSDQLRQIHGEWKRNEALLQRRLEHKREYRAADRKLRAARKECAVLGRRREALFRSLNVAGERELTQRREKLELREHLRLEQAALSREIAAALGGRGSEEELRARLEQYTLPQLEQRWSELSDRLAAVEKRLKELYEEQGRLQVRLDQIAADKSLPRKIFDLKNVERQIDDNLERWETLTVAQRLLEAVRKKYEAERQPETLREASRYFERLTEGRYKRVWTPLEAGVLYVDTDKGERLSVDVLSRGTREQLFLSLRLALVDLYARRGKVMPLVLDDVLVNFDTRRTRLAAELLCDFAGDRRQVLLFTCHEHIYRLFKTLRAQVRLLPGQTIDEQDEGPVRVVEKIVERVVKVKEPVYVPAAVAALPPLPLLDGSGVFELPPRIVRSTPPPPPPPPRMPMLPAHDDEADEVVVEPAPQTIVRTRRLGYPVVPLWNPQSPFATARQAATKE